MTGLLQKLRWYYFSRALGTTTVLYELFFATGTAERGTIILAGFGVLGYDLVARKDGNGKKNGTSA